MQTGSMALPSASDPAAFFDRLPEWMVVRTLGDHPRVEGYAMGLWDEALFWRDDGLCLWFVYRGDHGEATLHPDGTTGEVLPGYGRRLFAGEPQEALHAALCWLGRWRGPDLADLCSHTSKIDGNPVTG